MFYLAWIIQFHCGREYLLKQNQIAKFKFILKLRDRMTKVHSLNGDIQSSVSLLKKTDKFHYLQIVFLHGTRYFNFSALKEQINLPFASSKICAIYIEPSINFF